MDDVDERAQYLFKVLVDRYLDTGVPVASRNVAEQAGIKVSSATVRNVMATLEDRGLVASPHTSAGRIPTPRGLRFFVDSLLNVQPLTPAAVEALRGQLAPDQGTASELVATTSRLLSELTSMAGLVTLPREPVATLRQIEFLPLVNQRVLVILVLNDGEVQNRVIHVKRELDPDELQRAANYINSEYAGDTPGQIRDRLLAAMDADRVRVDRLMQLAVSMASSAFDEDDDASGSYVVAGETNLMAGDGATSVEDIRQLLEAFQHKREILDLLDRSLEADGVQLFIGTEAGVEVFEHYSVVTAPYELDGEVVGALGIIGPTRMHYERVIPLVDVTARLLGAAMTRIRTT